MTITRRPRDVGVLQSAAILYGDWGTSKAYVIGLAFAAAGYSSFWLIAGVCVLIVLVGLNYITICKYNPTGGGVYASVRKRSEIISLVGAFFLIADYLITAALSALSSFSYLGLAHPEYWAVGSMACIGFINIFGPRYSGNLAFFVAIPAVVTVFLISIAFIPFFDSSVVALQALHGDWFKNWISFVGIIIALSGIESIANTTGVMKLDPGTTEKNPSVHQTSKRAILIVMFEVCFFTALFGFAALAIPNLHVIGGEVFSGDNQSVRDSMLRYMGEFFVAQKWGIALATPFGIIIGLVFSILLLSAVNTAILAMASLLFIMSRDNELPYSFQKINRFGVPYYAVLISVVIPIGILLLVHDIASLADLYAVGFIGAIATNLASTSTDPKIPMAKTERFFMFTVCLVIVLVEITLLIYKPEARNFVFSIVAIGLILRSLVLERKEKALQLKQLQIPHSRIFKGDTNQTIHEGAILCANNTIGKTVDFAIQEAKQTHQLLNFLFIREQKVITEEDQFRSWLDDPKACEVFDYVRSRMEGIPAQYFYLVSDDSPRTIVDMAKKLSVSRVILGKSRRNVISKFFRGNITQEVADILPSNMDLLIIA